MYYYNSVNFYLDLEHFLSDEFKCIRKAFLFDLLPESEKLQLSEYINSIFPKEFLRLILILRKKYRADKLKIFLKNFFKNLKLQFKKTKCYIETHKVLFDSDLVKIETAIKKKFKLERIRFKYLVNSDLIYGISFRLNYKIYDLSLNNILNKVAEKTLLRIGNREE